MRGNVSSVSQRIGILRLVKRVFADTSILLHCFRNFFSQSFSIILWCGGQLMNVIFSFSSVRCIRWPGFARVRVSCHCVIDVMLLDCVCLSSLIRSRIIVCSEILYLLPTKFDILSCGSSSSIEVRSIKV